MRWIAIAATLSSAACNPRAGNGSEVWSGVDPTRITCDSPANYGTRVFCVADGVAYFCVGELRLIEDAWRQRWECAPVRSLADLERP